MKGDHSCFNDAGSVNGRLKEYGFRRESPSYGACPKSDYLDVVFLEEPMKESTSHE
ncbi:MAG: hypothetical protein HXS40_06645 [Theionarchaea archaeon]|nr:hypothetical protein [Theionarchaea archaeon]